MTANIKDEECAKTLKKNVIKLRLKNIPYKISKDNLFTIIKQRFLENIKI